MCKGRDPVYRQCGEKYRQVSGIFYRPLLQEQGGVTSCRDMFRKQWEKEEGESVWYAAQQTQTCSLNRGEVWP